MSETIDVRVSNLVYGGDAIGRLVDGRAVFIPFAIPDEMVRIRLIEEKARFARAELVEVLEPSPIRISARCRHFSQCGGCHYQHLKYSDQLNVKSAILREQLERIGGLNNLPPVEIASTPELSWNYRNHVQFHLTREGKLGFQKAHSNQTFPIEECHLPETAINQIWPRIDIEPIPGLERISVRSGWENDMMLVLDCSEPQALDFTIENLAISVVQKNPSGNLVLAGSDHLVMEVSGRQFRVSSTSFFQVNTLQANAMVKHIMANMPLNDAMTVVDVYCGVGLFSAFLASKAKQLVGIELSLEACDDFSINLDEFENVSLYEARAEDVLVSINFNPDVIVVDPPREGLGRNTINGILSQGASHMIYISCDPATLARDAKLLVSGGYELVKIALFDMFPQTYHIESISYWMST
jgi:23S rRNA (uracil1939-C5)-methyltransferase